MEDSDQMVDSSQLLLSTLRSRMDIASFVNRIDVAVHPTNGASEVSPMSLLAPSLSLSLALGLASNVQEICLRPTPSFTFIARTILILRPTLRALHLFTSEDYDNVLPSEMCAELLRGLPNLQKLSTDLQVIIDDQPHREPVTFQLTDLDFKTPDDGRGNPGPYTFNYITSSSTHSLRHLKITGPYLPSGRGAETAQDLEPFRSLQTLEISAGYPGMHGYNEDMTEARLDTEIAQVNYIIDELISTPATVQHIQISDYDGDDAEFDIRGEIIDKEDLLWIIPDSVLTVKLCLYQLQATTLLNVLTSEHSATKKWTHLEVVTEPCFDEIEQEKILEQCSKRGITFCCRGQGYR
ncbi:hypothetical protein P7C70_g6634, partial [Phenoliferia sp. Uapishka_3]